MDTAFNMDEIRELDAAFVENKPNVIFVYTPPKVGSSTLVSTLKYALYNTHAVVHVHDNVMLHVLTGHKFNPAITVNDLIKFNACILRRNVYVINIYRPLLDRKISEYFEHITTLHFNTDETNIGKYKMDLLIMRFNKLFPHIETIGDHYLDVYDIPAEQRMTIFDINRRYIHHRVLTTFGGTSSNINYVALRLMDANTHWTQILGKIFGNPDRFTLFKENVREEGGLHDVYKQFKASYKLPNMYREYLNTPASSFYEPDETETPQIALDSDVLITPYTEDEYKLYLQIALENSLTYGITKKNYKKYEERMMEIVKKTKEQKALECYQSCVVRLRVRDCGVKGKEKKSGVTWLSKKVTNKWNLKLY